MISFIFAIGDPRYWRSRSIREARQLQWSLSRERGRNVLGQSRERWDIAVRLALQSAPQVLTALLLISVVELAPTLLAGVPVTPLKWLAVRPGSGAYADLLAAGVGVVGTLLGLFYATVGVVASTVYQSVPATIRTLFIQEQSGVVYVAGVVRAATFGIAELALDAMGLAPSRFGLIVFVVLSLTALFRLAILGGRIFNFFDPSALASVLGNRALRAAKRASTASISRGVGAQRAAHHSASAALSTYLDLAVLIEAQQGRSTAGPRRLTNQLLQVLYLYGDLKSEIALESKWWDESPVHINWMTLDHTRLEMSLLTATGIAPTLEANRMWFEGAVARILARTFASAFAAGGSSLQLSFAESVANVTQQLAARHQVAEALTIERVWSIASRDLVVARPDRLADGSSSLNELAAAEQLVYPLIGAWLGLVEGVESARTLDFDATFRAIVSNSASLHSARLPQPTVEVLEKIRRGVVAEPAEETDVVAPGWWRNHYLAKSLLEHFVAEIELIRAEIDGTLASRTNELRDVENFEALSVLVVAQLELLHKLDSNFSRMTPSFDRLARMRNVATSDTAWPAIPDLTTWIVHKRSEVLQTLAVCLPHVRRKSHDPSRPDLHGQAFQYVFQALFESLLEGRDDLSRILFSAVFLEADIMRARVLRDLAGRDDTVKLIYGVEPVVSLMEISGLARLMQDVDGHGIWAEVSDLWTRILSSDQSGSSERLVQLLSALNSIFAMTSGGLMRTTRKQRLERLLRKRGVVGRQRHLFDDSTDAIPDTQTPLVTVFAPDSYGADHDLEDLFVADYLSAMLPEDFSYPWKIRSLIDALHSEGHGGDADPEPPAEGGERSDES